MSNIEELEQDIASLRREKQPANTVMREFEELFQQFPQLRDLLYKEYKGPGDETLLEPLQDQNLVEKFQTPSRKRPKTKSSDNLPEDEWVLQNQVPLEHNLFDKSVGDILDTEILSSPSKRRQRLNGDDRSSIGNLPLDNLHDQIMVENIFRLFGITFFPVVDPSDLQMNIETQEMDTMREMLGIRLDIFDELSKKYDKPMYILLKKKIKSDTWDIFKHTIPSYIGVEKIFEEVSAGLAISYEDIYLFSKEIYLQLLKESARKGKLKKFEEKGLISNLRISLSSTKVSFSIGTFEIELYLQDNIIISCSFVKGIRDASVRSKWEVLFNGPLEDLEYKLRQLK
ncbi:hypothetical protein KAFR_0C01870 [Kazachstania africana CBS 2517]|uniref:Uncharacterized protein n=1 Tax=Kazachstania africana (strain ATCC 22294 / BCRC 22015 / CBS 2517 / CECT 1963 / NBRC 1671 / NRRL Y-8276) TaxID=1071382 RepID=H2AS30_KAZAF|nr:hypothetical protein KAFR_0C01870 [Kazachstania africana CBS 2517]CCF57180.1 hypothetical protein KAFR_0C01870 [Kazachstania africana CBS 2517]